MADPARIWDEVCRHIDGMAIGSTMAALSSRGALRMLTGAERTEFGKLRARLGANAGFLQVAVRLLADQGWVTCAGEGGTDELVITPTADGRVVMTAFAGVYAEAVRFLPLARQAGELASAAADPFVRQWDLPASRGRQQVLTHLNGHVIAPLMFALTGQDAAVPAGAAARILARQGWVTSDGCFTPEGEIALKMARQYRYPVIYLPLLRAVPELIFGDPARASSGYDTHLDRDLDLRFSGDVFAATCRAPFLDIALPLFDREPVADQPAMVVDVGCGDGTLLQTLHAAILGRTRRGRQLAEYPLLMVGADPSPVALRMTAARLSAAGIPHLVMDGDIADPAGLARELGVAGHDAGDALHVCKSAIHDRAYREPGSSPGSPPTALTAFAHPDGTAIPASRMAVNLAEQFRAWLPLARRHGWIVIEAHSAPAATVTALIGRSPATALDATHGYSCQYPVEPEVFAWAARAGGFTSRAHHEPAAGAIGHTLLTIDHFVVSEGR